MAESFIHTDIFIDTLFLFWDWKIRRKIEISSAYFSL